MWRRYLAGLAFATLAMGLLLSLIPSVMLNTSAQPSMVRFVVKANDGIRSAIQDKFIFLNSSGTVDATACGGSSASPVQNLVVTYTGSGVGHEARDPVEVIVVSQTEPVKPGTEFTFMSPYEVNFCSFGGVGYDRVTGTIP